jgi:hypothetical protein
VSRLNVITNKWATLAGQGMSAAAQAAIAAGAEYSWSRRAVSPSIALLWRTAYDPDTASGFSGSVLCLGRKTDSEARAIVFQNFQVPVRQDDVIHDHRKLLGWDHHAVLKAGFLLPEEIRQSVIQMTGSISLPTPQSLNPAKRASTDNQRRSLSGV